MLVLNKSFIDFWKREFGEVVRKAENNILENYKRKLLAILNKQEKEETEEENAEIEKSMLELDGDFIEKGKAANIGEVREWKGKKYVKIAPGKWKRKYDKIFGRGSLQALRNTKKRIANATSLKELTEIVKENRLRFSDENGNPLQVVESLFKDARNEIAKKNGMDAKMKSGREKMRQKFAEKKKAEEKTKVKPLSVSDFPKELKKGVYGKYAEEVIEYLNGLENPNPVVMDIFRNLKNIEFDVPVTMKTVKEGGAKFRHFYDLNNGQPIKSELKIIKISKSSLNYNFAVGIYLHEMTHLIDFFTRPDKTVNNSLSVFFPPYDKAVKKTVNISDNIKSFIDNTLEMKKAFCKKFNDELEKINNDFDNGKYKNYDDYLKEFNSVKENILKISDKYTDFYAFCDIYDALSEGEIFKKYGTGHGKKVFSNTKEGHEHKLKEILAEYSEISLTSPELVKKLEQDRPDLKKALDGIINIIKSKLTGEIK